MDGRNDAGVPTDLLTLLSSRHMNKKSQTIRSAYSRRKFLELSGAAAVGALTASAPRLWSADSSTAVNNKPPQATADHIILLWMGGGMAQTDTFDPKPYRPFEAGMDPRHVLSTFPAIDTAVDHIKFCEGLENIAGVMDRGTLIRSYVSASDIKDHAERVNHLPGQLLWHTGYRPPLTVAVPHIGAIIANVLGPYHEDIPPFINIGSGSGNKAAAAFESYGVTGFLGNRYAPLEIPEPAKGAEMLKSRLTPDKFASRYKYFKKLIEAGPTAKFAGDYQKQGMLDAMEQAYRLVTSPSASAFDLSSEPKHVYEAYDTGNFGLGCLLARRLVEAGSRFIEVEISFDNTKGWDLHSDGHRGIKSMKKLIDQPAAQLIRDLDERQMLDRTLVILASEMGRAVYRLDRAARKFKDGDKITKMKEYGMNNHFGGAGNVLMFGGGVKRGHLHGRTADEYPCGWTEDPVTIEHLHATMYQCLGISPRHSYEVERRPFYITKDGNGKPIKSLLS